MRECENEYSSERVNECMNGRVSASNVIVLFAAICQVPGNLSKNSTRKVSEAQLRRKVCSSVKHTDRILPSRLCNRLLIAACGCNCVFILEIPRIVRPK